MREEMLCGLWDGLLEEMKARGHGTISATAEAVGVRPDYFTNKARECRRSFEDGTAGDPRRPLVNPNVMTQALEFLNVPAQAFAAKSFGLLKRMAPVERFCMEAELLCSRVRMPDEASLLLGCYLNGRAASDGHRCSPEFLSAVKAVDKTRRESPGRAIQTAMKLASHVRQSAEASALLGSWASALRADKSEGLKERLRLAQVLLSAGISIAKRNSLESLLGDLLQRASYVVGDAEGDHEFAYLLALEAERIYARMGDSDKRGRALVDQGIALHDLGDYTAAKVRLKDAWSNLSSGSISNRRAAAHTLGYILAAEGHVEKAETWVSRALCLGTPNSFVASRLLWLRALIAQEAGLLRDAERYYIEALECIGSKDPVSSAMLTAELTPVLLELGKTQKARIACKAMRALLIPIEQDVPAAATAVCSLIVAAQQTRFHEVGAQIAARAQASLMTQASFPRIKGR